MELDKVIQTRRSIRKFAPDPVSDEMIHALLEAARLAPSGSNIQPWRFVVIKSTEMKERLRVVTACRFALKAPVLLVCCADLTAIEASPAQVTELLQAGVFNGVEIDNGFSIPGKNKEQALGYLSLNVGIAITHIILKAVDLGLGTCWIGAFDPKTTQEILELDPRLHVVALLPVGYPERVPTQRPRFSMEKLLVKTV